MKTLIVLVAACVIAAALRIDIQHGRATAELYLSPTAARILAALVCGIIIGRYVVPDGYTVEEEPETEEIAD